MIALSDLKYSFSGVFASFLKNINFKKHFTQERSTYESNSTRRAVSAKSSLREQLGRVCDQHSRGHLKSTVRALRLLTVLACPAGRLGRCGLGALRRPTADLGLLFRAAVFGFRPRGEGTAAANGGHGKGAGH